MSTVGNVPPTAGRSLGGFSTEVIAKSTLGGAGLGSTQFGQPHTYRTIASSPALLCTLSCNVVSAACRRELGPLLRRARARAPSLFLGRAALFEFGGDQELQDNGAGSRARPGSGSWAPRPPAA